MKKCAFCAEEIQDEAVKCRYCGEMLGAKPPQPQDPKTPWYFQTKSLVVGTLVLGPLVLPAVWFNPKNSLTKKVIATVLILGLTALLMVWFGTIMKDTANRYQALLSGLDGSLKGV